MHRFFFFLNSFQLPSQHGMTSGKREIYPTGDFSTRIQSLGNLSTARCDMPWVVTPRVHTTHRLLPIKGLRLTYVLLVLLAPQPCTTTSYNKYYCSTSSLNGIIHLIMCSSNISLLYARVLLLLGEVVVDADTYL